ncbi:Amidase signature domain containing protein [Naviculisporaceae sp. PSN 640]
MSDMYLLGRSNWSLFRTFILIASVIITPANALLSNPFDPLEATIPSIHSSLFTNEATCREIISSFLSRIEALNPSINAVISLSPEALRTAEQIDTQLSTGNTTGKLLCIPVLLKDNFDAVPMATTNGCLALANNYPLEDAPVVKALKSAGAVILGKTNLHEMALEGLTVSSLGGQTLNPYDFTRTPGGSSGGSGAALAAGFAVLATGTDTMNSLRSPASANGLFSFRPSRGLVSRDGVVPVSETQDAVGAMARDVRDLETAWEVMVEDYGEVVVVGERRFPGLGLGLLDGFFEHMPSEETTPVNKLMEGMISSLKRSGVEIVNVTESVYNTTALLELDVQMYEFSELLDEYLAKPKVDNGQPRPLGFKDIYNDDGGEKNFLVIPRHYKNIRKALVSSTKDPGYAESKKKIAELRKTLEATFSRHNLDAMIYPEQKNLVVKIGSESQYGRNGILAALTGYPVVTVPIGFSPATEDAPRGVPVGMEILGQPGDDQFLLRLARDMYDEKLLPLGGRKVPEFADVFVESKYYEKVPDVRPDRGNIPGVYPLGVF